MSKIVFTDTIGVPDEFKPKPSKNNIPEWYKNLDSYMGGNKILDINGSTTATIKKCMPMFDALTAGYILFTHETIYISQQKVEYGDGDFFRKTGQIKLLTSDEKKEQNLETTQPYYGWSANEPISFHLKDQAPTHPNNNGHMSYPKWINPWSIKTKPGYSSLFLQPTHRESVFSILPGIVDTDTYDSPVHFPFVLNNKNFEGVIPAGTPMAQVIPFKREIWEMEIGSQKELDSQSETTSLLKSKSFESYKSQFRKSKEYN